MNKVVPKYMVVTESPVRGGSRYPAPYDEPCKHRTKYILGDQFDLTQFGVNLAVLPPGAWSSQRHWHEKEDEFIYVLEGEITLSDNSGDHVLKPGMCAGFKANDKNGHCLKNLTDSPVVYLEVGTRSGNEHVIYSDIDMQGVQREGGYKFLKKDGSEF